MAIWGYAQFSDTGWFRRFPIFRQIKPEVVGGRRPSFPYHPQTMATIRHTKDIDIPGQKDSDLTVLSTHTVQ